MWLARRGNIISSTLPTATKDHNPQCRYSHDVHRARLGSDSGYRQLEAVRICVLINLYPEASRRKTPPTAGAYRIRRTEIADRLPGPASAQHPTVVYAHGNFREARASNIYITNAGELQATTWLNAIRSCAARFHCYHLASHTHMSALSHHSGSDGAGSALQSHSYPVPKPCTYVPAITFYKKDGDELDAGPQSRYYAYLANTGLTGLVVLGTNAETLLLTREERKALLELARKSVPKGFPIVAGVMGHSTAQVLEYIADAHGAGADYLLILPCAYFGKQTTQAVIKSFFADIETASPLPIILYNFPAVCNGIDLDSDIITALAQAHPNIVGVKLTCGSVAKIARLAATFPSSRFVTFGGQSDFLLGGLAVGSAGCIAAFANVFPRSVAQLYWLWEQGRHEEALALQQTLSLAEQPTKTGIASTKFAAAIGTARRAGIKDAEVLLRPRRPYVGVSVDQQRTIRENITRLANLEDTAFEGKIVPAKL